MDELRSWGVDYLLLCHEDYGKLFREGVSPRDLELRAFYEQVMREGQLLWHGDQGDLSYIHPGLSLYSIRLDPKHATERSGEAAEAP